CGEPAGSSTRRATPWSATIGDWTCWRRSERAGAPHRAHSAQYWKGISAMEYRQLGRSGLKISALTMGTMTFGGQGDFAVVGDTDVDGARRKMNTCLDAGINLIDTADIYSDGRSEEIVGEALGDKRGDVLLATKVRFPMGDGPNM